MAEITFEDASKKYPDWAWALNIPQVGDLIRKAITDPDYSNQRLETEIQQTDWWKSTQASARKWDALKATDPESANAQMREVQAQIWDKRQSMGMHPDVDWVRDTAEKSLKYGWGSSQLNDYLVSQLQYNPNVSSSTGTLSTTMAKLKSSALEYNVMLSDQTAFDYSKAIMAGEHTADDWSSIWREQAKAQYQYSPELLSALDKGITVKQYTDPIKQRIASILEVNPDSIDLNSSKYSQALDHTDSQGKRRMMTYGEVDQLARSQPEFRTTVKAQQSAASLGENILKTFGKVA